MPLRRTRSPRCRESPRTRADACLTRLRRLALVLFLVCAGCGAGPRPAPPDWLPELLVLDVEDEVVFEPDAAAGAAQARAAASTSAAYAADARSSCVARVGRGYDKN